MIRRSQPFIGLSEFMSNSMGCKLDANFREIPVVDLRRWRGTTAERSAFSVELREICHHIGFFALVGHGVDDDLVSSVFDVSQRLFALPTEDKLRIDKRNSQYFRGWEGEGAEYTNNRPDIREQVDLWSEHPPRPMSMSPAYYRLLGPNQWLPEAVLPGFRATLERWFKEAGALADELMRILAVGLELPEDRFETLFGVERMSLTKLIRYPATPVGQFGVNAHHDTGFLTVLAPGKTPGLQVQNDDGEWIPVPPTSGAFIINLGEMLQSITGNFYVATPHRVVTAEPRYSVGYFHGPSLDTSLAPLTLAPWIGEAVAASPRHAQAGFMAKREETEAGISDMSSEHRPATYGEQLWNYFARSYPDNMRRHHADCWRAT